MVSLPSLPQTLKEGRGGRGLMCEGRDRGRHIKTAINVDITGITGARVEVVDIVC